MCYDYTFSVGLYFISPIAYIYNKHIYKLKKGIKYLQLFNILNILYLKESLVKYKKEYIKIYNIKIYKI